MMVSKENCIQNNMSNDFLNKDLKNSKKKFALVMNDIKYLGKKFNYSEIIYKIINTFKIEKNEFYSCPPRYRHLGNYEVSYKFINTLNQ